jgi:hypothetical protein
MSVEEKLTTIAENEKKIYDTAIFESGKRAVYDNFWDIYQDNGNREHYSYAFAGRGWTDENFKPKYDIRPGSTMATNMFAYSQITDLVSMLNRQGIVLDTSQSTDIGAMFTYCSNLITCPPIDASSAKHCGSLFQGCGHIDDITLTIKNDGSQTFTNTFLNCHKLSDLWIEGVIGKSINLQWSYLNRDCAIQIMQNLKNYSGSSEEYVNTLKFSDDTWSWVNTYNPPNGYENWKLYLTDIGWKY